MYDAIVVVTGCAARHAVMVLKRLVERYPEVTTKCGNFKFAETLLGNEHVINAYTYICV